MKVFRLFLSLLILVSVVVCADTIDSIQIVGNERITEDTIKAKLGVKEGDEFLSDMSSTIINGLIGTNFFDDVSIEFDDGLLRVKVVEGLLVSNISFKGNNAVEDKELKKFLALKNRLIFSKKKLREDISRIIAMYRAKGYYLTRVIPRIEKKTKGLINIVYEIYEGKEAKIKHIRFMGNTSFSSIALKDVIVSKEWRWWALLGNDDVFEEQRIEMDRNALQDFYRNNGHARFKILNVLTELTNDKENFIITFILEEGEKYIFDNVSLTCNLSEVEGDKLAKLVKAKIPHGMSYDPSKINGAELELIDYLAAFGYPFNLIEKDIRLDEDKKTVSVDFSINEGRKVYVNRVEIHNNVRTQDKVIRREMKISEGDPLNVLNIERSKRSIEGLGFFQGVAVTQADSGIPDKVDVKVNVAEGSTGYFNFGGGYKSGPSNGILLKVNFGERNFLGTGRDVALDFERGPMEDGESGGKVDFSITEPYFLGRNLSVGLNISRANTLRKDNGFTIGQGTTNNKRRKRRNTVGIHAGYKLIEDLSHAIGYRFVSQRFASKSTEITSQVWQQFFYDKLDSPVDPKDGYRLKFIQSFSGLGGDTKHIEHGIEGKFYSPIFFR